MEKLLAVYLWGKGPGALMEQHDMRFAVAKNIIECFEQLEKQPDAPFGGKFHVDGYVELKYVDGYEIVLVKENIQDQLLKLFVVNVGFYHPQKLGEFHELYFSVAQDSGQAKQKALKQLRDELGGGDVSAFTPHKDNLYGVAGELDGLYDVDDCAHIQIPDRGIQFVPTDKTQNFDPLRQGFWHKEALQKAEITHTNYPGQKENFTF